MKQRLLVGPVALLVSTLTACAVSPDADRGGDPQDADEQSFESLTADEKGLVDEAKASTEMENRVIGLQKLGWTVAGWSQARVLHLTAEQLSQAPAGTSPSAVALTATKVVGGKTAKADVLFVPNCCSKTSSLGGHATLKPRDDAAAQDLATSLADAQSLHAAGAPTDGVAKNVDSLGIEQSSAPDGTSPDSYPNWWCSEWVYHVGLTPWCFSDGNPFGYFYQVVEVCGGGLAWYASYNGCAVSSPLYGYYWGWSLCGMMPRPGSCTGLY